MQSFNHVCIVIHTIHHNAFYCWKHRISKRLNDLPKSKLQNQKTVCLGHETQGRRNWYSVHVPILPARSWGPRHGSNVTDWVHTHPYPGATGTVHITMAACSFRCDTCIEYTRDLFMSPKRTLEWKCCVAYTVIFCSPAQFGSRQPSDAIILVHT